MSDDALLALGMVGVLLAALAFNRFLHWWDARPPKPKRYGVGDKVPDHLLAEWTEGGKNLGAMIKVCPDCKRIDAIFFP